MTELKAFLTAFYDSLSEAELQALEHGQLRLAELLESGRAPPDVSVPVYHATDMELTLDVGLEARRTEEGLEMHVTEARPEDGTSVSFTVELYDLLERGDIADLEYDDILPDDGSEDEEEDPEDGDEDGDDGSGNGTDGDEDGDDGSGNGTDGDEDADDGTPGAGVVDVEELPLGGARGPPEWFRPGEGNPGAVRRFDHPKAVHGSSLFEWVGGRAEEVREFVGRTDFGTSVLLCVVSVGPNSCHDRLAVSELAVEDDTLVGTALAEDTSGPDEECLQVVRYPATLLRVTVEDAVPEAVRLSITDGMGNEATVGADRDGDAGGEVPLEDEEPDDGTDEEEERTDEEESEEKEERTDEEESDEKEERTDEEERVDEEGDETEDGDRNGGRIGRPSVRPVETVDGIDSRHAELLRSRGIETAADVAAADPEELAAATRTGGEEVPPEESRRWVEQARGLRAVLSAVDDGPVELVDGIGPAFGSRLRERGIEDLDDLVTAPPEEIAEIASTDRQSVSVDRAERWREEAIDLLEPDDEDRERR